MPPTHKVHPAIKAVIALVLLAGLGFLFVRSVKDARAEPYQMSSRHLTGWTLGIDTASDADGAVVSLRPPAELPMNLFRQLFSRQMESLSLPTAPGIPLVLRRELPGSVTAGAVLALAQSAGLQRATIAPKCVGYQRVSALGVTRQLYYVAFDVPGFDAVRQSLAQLAGFDSVALTPVMMMAAEPNFVGWLPIVNAERDCVAPVVVE
jgi:hypothetical protein